MKEESIFYLILRILVGVIFIIHGLSKTNNLIRWNNFLISKNSTLGYSFSSFVAYLEVVLGCFILLGFLTRISALVGILFMCVAIYVAHIQDPVITYIYQLSIISVLFCIATQKHGGEYSIDYILHK